jgi:hypothetical protein
MGSQTQPEVGCFEVSSRPGRRFAVPDHFRAEVGGVLRRRELNGVLTPQEAASDPGP